MSDQHVDEAIELIRGELGNLDDFSRADLQTKLLGLENSKLFQKLSFKDKISVRYTLAIKPAFLGSFKTTWGLFQWASISAFAVVMIAWAGLTIFAPSPEPRASVTRATQPTQSVTRVARPTQPRSEVKEMTPANRYCNRVTGVSKGFSEDAARRLRVSASSVTLLSSVANSSPVGGCWVRLDTPKGPQNCRATRVYSDGKDFWLGGVCM